MLWPHMGFIIFLFFFVWLKQKKLIKRQTNRGPPRIGGAANSEKIP